jgi:hypothetical protein
VIEAKRLGVDYAAKNGANQQSARRGTTPGRALARGTVVMATASVGGHQRLLFCNYMAV